MLFFSLVILNNLFTGNYLQAQTKENSQNNTSINSDDFGPRQHVIQDFSVDDLEPLSEAEEENEENDDDDNQSDIVDYSSNDYLFLKHNLSPKHFLSFSANSIKLYILFHSWRSFIS